MTVTVIAILSIVGAAVGLILAMARVEEDDKETEWKRTMHEPQVWTWSEKEHKITKKTKKESR
jgi:hypothetical protein